MFVSLLKSGFQRQTSRGKPLEQTSRGKPPEQILQSKSSRANPQRQTSRANPQRKTLRANFQSKPPEQTMPHSSGISMAAAQSDSKSRLPSQRPAVPFQTDGLSPLRRRSDQMFFSSGKLSLSAGPGSPL